MSEPAADDVTPTSPMRVRAVAALAALAVWFALLAAPAWHTPMLRRGFYTFYLLSLPFVLLALGVVAIAGFVGLRRLRGAPTWHPWHRTLLVVGLGGYALCAASALTVLAVDGGLPIGSHAAPFDVDHWRSAGAADLARDDLAPRQKMVGDLVDRVLPGLTRDEITALLGPAPDTRYLSHAGHDLMYPLGFERGLFAERGEWLLIWLYLDGRYAFADVRTD